MQKEGKSGKGGGGRGDGARQRGVGAGWGRRGEICRRRVVRDGEKGARVEKPRKLKGGGQEEEDSPEKSKQKGWWWGERLGEVRRFQLDSLRLALLDSFGISKKESQVLPKQTNKTQTEASERERMQKCKCCASQFPLLCFLSLSLCTLFSPFSPTLAPCTLPNEKRRVREVKVH